MLEPFKINVGNMLLSISDAVDMVNPAIASHQLRTAFIAWQMAKAAGLPRRTIKLLFKAALLHDIGALAPEEKMKLHALEKIDPSPHCIIGELLFKMTPLLDDAAGIIRFHHRKWSDWNAPIETPQVLESQILYTADLVERLIRRDVFVLEQVDTITSTIKEKSGDEIHDGVVDIFMGLAAKEDFWLDVVNSRLYTIMQEHGPLHGIEEDFSVLLSMASLVRNLIDFKSVYTATHSIGVTECAVQLARLEDFADIEIQCMEVAGNFHDLGKLAIPVAILDKTTALTAAEYAIMKQHPYYTYTVLRQIGMDQLAQWAAFHHELLDGTGYPFHLKYDTLTLGSRIMAIADIFTSLYEERPHRPGRDWKDIKEILTDYARKERLDPKIIKVLIDNHEDISNAVKEKQDEAMRYYEHKVKKVVD